MTKVAWVWLRSVEWFDLVHSLVRQQAAQKIAEAVQAAFGAQPLTADPVRGGLQGPGTSWQGQAVLRRGDYACLLEDAQVLDDRGRAISKGLASSLTDAGPRDSRSTMARGWSRRVRGTSVALLIRRHIPKYQGPRSTVKFTLPVLPSPLISVVDTPSEPGSRETTSAPVS